MKQLNKWLRHSLMIFVLSIILILIGYSHPVGALQNDGQMILKFYPIEDETNLNQRRTEMGLGTFEEEYEEIKNRR